MSAFRWDSNITEHFDNASTYGQTVVFRIAGAKVIFLCS
jgi:hypothetical protein